MPVSYSVDHGRQRVHAVASGKVGVADLASYIAARVKDGIYDYDQTLDFSDAELDIVSHDVVNMVKQARPNLGKKPIPYTAIIARTGSATYGLARQLATLFDFEGATVHIVETMKAANAWLDEIRSGQRVENHRE